LSLLRYIALFTAKEYPLLTSVLNKPMVGSSEMYLGL